MKWRLIMVLISAACGSIAPHQVDPLDDAIRSYNDGVRWGRYELAAAYIAPKERAQFVDDADERSKDLHITQFEVVQVERRGSRAANAHVKVEWYKESEGTLRETHARQTWEKHGRAWLMVHETRVRGHEMPGLPEPSAPELPDSTSEPLDSTNPAVRAPPGTGPLKGG